MGYHLFWWSWSFELNWIFSNSPCMLVKRKETFCYSNLYCQGIPGSFEYYSHCNNSYFEAKKYESLEGQLSHEIHGKFTRKCLFTCNWDVDIWFRSKLNRHVNLLRKLPLEAFVKKCLLFRLFPQEIVLYIVATQHGSLYFIVYGLTLTRDSHALVRPPPMSSCHHILEPYGRWHATIYKCGDPPES